MATLSKSLVKKLEKEGRIPSGSKKKKPAYQKKVRNFSEEKREINFIIPGNPIGKPRMSQRDKWQKRERVENYRAWCDKARLMAPRNLPTNPDKIWIRSFIALSKGLKPREKELRFGKPHRIKPDADNLCKSVMDALWKEDSGAWDTRSVKYWEDEGGPRMEVTVEVF